MTEMVGYRLVEQQWIDAPPARVFRAWTDPGEVRTWWRIPGAYETTEAEIDLRVGGRYRFAGTSEARGTFEVSGEYREVVPGERLVYTWIPDWDDGARESVVTLTFESEAGGTRLGVEHVGFATERSRDDHAWGWPAVAGQLRAYVEGD